MPLYALKSMDGHSFGSRRQAEDDINVLEEINIENFPQQLRVACKCVRE